MTSAADSTVQPTDDLEPNPGARECLFSPANARRISFDRNSSKVSQHRTVRQFPGFLNHAGS